MMRNLQAVARLVNQAETGNTQAVGDLWSADEVIGFSFGIYFDDQGQFLRPGPVNEAMAEYIVATDTLRQKPMTLQEELAVAVTALDSSLKDQITPISTIKRPGLAYKTHEVLNSAKPGLRKREVGTLAVIAFRHHLPRAAEQVRKAGFSVVHPSMQGIGDFDPESPQGWIHGPDAWMKRERVAIAMVALNLI